MISLDPLMNFASGSTGAYGGQGESQSNGWLLELERAWLDSEKDRKNAPRSGTDAHADSSKADAGEASADGRSGAAPRAGTSPGTAGPGSSQPAFFVTSASKPRFDSRMSAIFASLGQPLEASPSASQPFTDTRTGSARVGVPEKLSLSRVPAEPQSAEKDGSRKAPETADGDAAYPEKRLHLLEDEHGVRIWIRDAALSEERGHAVANALRGELGAAGLRLVSVALNGREIPGRADSSAEYDAALSAQDADHARSMIDESNLSIEKLSQKEHS